jgi:glycosyltransferase involved in cell wall biosynthesis
VRILLITATYPPSANGVAVSVNNLFKEFREMGHKVVVLAPSNNGKNSVSDNVIRYPSLPNPVIKDYPIPLLPITAKIMKLLYKTRFDIVHAHHPSYIYFFADIVSVINNVPLVFTYHTRYGQYIKENLKFLPKKLSKKVAGYSVKRVCKNADLVIAPSKFMEALLAKKYPDTKIETVPTGLSKFDNPKESVGELRKKNKLPRDKTILLSVSRIAREKNSQLLIRTMNFLGDKYHLVMVGTGPQEDKLKRMTEKRGLQNKVTFVGKVPHGRVSEFYKLADILVFPSFTETQGLTLLEAAHFGLRTVAVESAVNREWLTQGAGLLSENDPSKFAETIIKVNSICRESASKKAKKFFKKFTIEKTAGRLLDLYNQAIKEKTGRVSKRKMLKAEFRRLEEFLTT